MPHDETTNRQKLVALEGYLEFVLSKFPAPDGENESEDPLILILVCMQKTLERRIAKRLPTRDWCDVMRWSVIEANKLIDEIYERDEHIADWNPMTTPTNMQQNLAAMLMHTQHELIGDVAEGEAYLKEELKQAAEEFFKERWAEYEAGTLELEAEDGQAEKIA
jgi:hypothetical protein